ncbi:MAG: DUF2062 domain-containing protein [Proteobacteria bacterium]|nr:DUF2062 domain-containing protein [Pseudomonadota bacterium]MBU1686508.1 DUF2062 domain-containing protein [Pseudomonadota bacterium]
MDLRRTVRFYYLKLLRIKGDPESLARGVALGTFIGITPTIPLHTGLTILLSVLFRTSKVSALLMTFVVSNPLTFFPQYYFSWFIGNLLLPGHLSRERIEAIMAMISSGATFFDIIMALGHLGFSALIVLLLGGSILAAPFALCSYLLSLKIFKSVAAQRLTRQTVRDNNAD